MPDAEGVMPITAADGPLRRAVETIHQAGLTARPVFLSDDAGEAAVAIISAAQFAALADEFDALVTGRLIAGRLSSESEKAITVTVQGLADEMGVGIDDPPSSPRPE